jgi:hypothetical protein
LCAAGGRRCLQKHAGDRAFPHTRPPCLTGNGNCLVQYTKEQARHARLMLDALIETVAYDPLAIFMVVAVVLFFMLARTL